MSENIMAFSALSGAAAEGLGAFGVAGAQEAQGRWARETAEFDSRMMELQAQDAERRGNIAANRTRAAGRRIIGSQRAALAAQGVDVSTGSAVDVQEDTAYQAELDAQQITANAWREAWGLRTQSQERLFQGRTAEMAGKQTAAATALTGGLRMVQGSLTAASAWNSGKKKEDSHDASGKPVARASWLERKLWEMQ